MNIPGLDELARRKLTRKEFLQVMGLTVMSIIGVTRFLQYDQTSKKDSKKPLDYGEFDYGA